jgi:hypothetical protein
VMLTKLFNKHQHLRLVAIQVLISITCLACSESTPPSTEQSFNTMKLWQQSHEPIEFREFRERFVKIFNADKRRPLSPLLSNSLTKPGKMSAYLKYIRREHGKIGHLSFKYFDRRKPRKEPELLAVYLATFSTGALMEFRFGLDDTGNIERLFFSDPNFNEALPELASKTPLRLPFASGEQWYVLWGGETQELNYHVTVRSQRNAIDLLIKHPYSLASYESYGNQNQHYYAFDKTVLAPADGEIIKLINDVKDNQPGEMNASQLTGNTIIIKTDQDEYLLLAHLKQGSIRVAEGERLQAGQVVAKVGNSGNSSEPHLHMQLMDAENMANATGIRMRFDDIELNHESKAMNYALIKTNFVASPAK